MSLSSWYAQYVRAVCRAPRVAAALVMLACAWPAWQTVQLFTSVKADLQELLPTDSQAARALQSIHDRIPSQGHITVVAHGKFPEKNRAFIEALATNLRASGAPRVAWVQADVRAERRWLRLRAPLLMSTQQFDSLVDDVAVAINKRKARANPLFVSLDDGDKDDDWLSLQRRVQADVAAKDRFPNGYLETPEGDTVIAIVWLRGSDVDIDTARLLKADVQKQVERTGVPQGVNVAYTGDAANFIDEHDAIIADLSSTSIVVLVLVTALVALYFRSLTSVVAALAALLPGLLFAFGLGRLMVGHLNSNTAFLGSIIAGNGINYPLLFLSFYRRRETQERLPFAIVGAARAALPGTLGAAATASAAYGGLAVSGFRGFSQFGYLGGFGMIATWLMTYLCLPIAIAWLRPQRLGAEATSVERQVRRFFFTPWLAKGTALALITLTAALCGVGLWQVRRHGLYEMRLEVLRNRRSLATGSASWDATMNRLFGSWVNPVIGLATNPSDREAMAGAFEASLKNVPRPLVDRIETIETFVPKAAEQERRFAKLKRLQAQMALADEENLPTDIKQHLDLWWSDAGLSLVTRAEVPPPLLRNLIERDGSSDKTVLIYPSTAIDYGDGRHMITLAEAIESTPKPSSVVVGGPFLFMAALFKLVHAEAPRVVCVVFLLVLSLLVVLYYQKPSRVVIAALVIGPVALVAQILVVGAGIRVNMLNFAAVPITIGVGADYLLNLYGAMDGLGLNARAACARMGGAILLCSLTTVVGYGSLLMAFSGALRSFGWSAVVGEFMAVLVVLIVLPAFSRVKTSQP
ncbi:MAG: MMPL family transporter [Deltaproteobacteria bacterium]|nr:MMPL family transporter [Deltaproteobacteria bacterium]